MAQHNQLAILLALRPRFAEAIYSGDKSVELRRVKPKRIRPGTLVAIYETSPVRSITGYFVVDKLFFGPIDHVKAISQGRAAVSINEFNEYFRDATNGLAIFLSQQTRLSKTNFAKEGVAFRRRSKATAKLSLHRRAPAAIRFW